MLRRRMICKGPKSKNQKKIKPNSFIQNLTGLIIQKSGQMLDAIKYYEYAHSLDNKNISPLNNLAYIYEKIKYLLGYAPGVCAAIFGIRSFPRKANGSPKALPCYFWVCAGYAPGTKNSTVPLPDPEAPKTVG